MRYGAMTFPIKPILDEIEAVAAMEMDFIEIAMDAPWGHYRHLESQRAAIRKALQQNRLGLVCHMPTFVYSAHLTDAIRDASVQEVLGSLVAAARLGAEKVVLHPGIVDGLAVFIQETALAHATRSMAQFVAAAKRLDLVLCIENLFPRLGPYAQIDAFERLFQQFDSARFVLDVGHAHIDDPSGSRVFTFIERFADRLEHLHLSDNRGVVDDHLPIGKGTLPMKSVVRALAAAGFNGTATLEIFGHPRQSIVESRNVVEAMFDAYQG